MSRTIPDDDGNCPKCHENPATEQEHDCPYITKLGGSRRCHCCDKCATACGIKSASQFQTGKRCLRKWWFPKWGEGEKEETEALRRGTEIHDALEAYVKGETELDEIEDPYIHAAARTEIVQRFREGCATGDIHAELEFSTPGLDVRGKIDVSGKHWNVPFIADYKTTSGWQWMKTEKELRDDPQVHVYGRYVFDVLMPHLDEITIIYIYIHKKTPGTREVEFILTREENAAYWDSQLAPLAKKMDEYAPAKSAADVPKNLDACGDFRGCPFQTLCRKCEGKSRFSTASTTPSRRTRMDMQERIAAAKAKRAGAAAPKPEPKPEKKELPNPFELKPVDITRLVGAGIATDDALNVAKYAFNQGLDEVMDAATASMNDDQGLILLEWMEKNGAEAAPPTLTIDEAVALETSGMRITTEQMQALSQADKLTIIKLRGNQGAETAPINSPDASDNHAPGKPLGKDGVELSDFEKAGVKSGIRTALRKAGYQTFEDLAALPRPAKGTIKGLGPAKITELEEVMKAAGYAFLEPEPEQTTAEAVATAVGKEKEAAHEVRQPDYNDPGPASSIHGHNLVVYVECAPQDETPTLEALCFEMAEDIAEAKAVGHWTDLNFNDYPNALSRVFQDAYQSGMIQGELVVGDRHSRLVKAALEFLRTRNEVRFVVGTR